MRSEGEASFSFRGKYISFHQVQIDVEYSFFYEFLEKSVRNYKMTTHINTVKRLRMNGPLSPCVLNSYIWFFLFCKFLYAITNLVKGNKISIYNSLNAGLHWSKFGQQ